MDGFGTITWWGFSPALDLQETGVAELMHNLKLDSAPDTVNILVVGAGDLRHVLMTIARRKRHPHRKLHFYIAETAMELYARHMLFLTIALETQKRLGLQEKTELFLELYGNLLVRKQSAEYVERMSTDFIKMVTDFDYLERKLPCLDLSQLKFKERDFLEGIFKLWRNPKPELFDAKKCWELRLRQYLGTRYDSRFNVFDWDYSMHLVERGAQIINFHMYKRWRNTGQAFEVREGSYDVPNKTLSSGFVFKQDGERHPRRGYWGDIIVSPYIPLGIECEEKSFFKKMNDIYIKTSEDIAEYNVLAIFHELALGEHYSLPAEESKTETSKDSSPKLQEIREEEEEEEEKTESSGDKETTEAQPGQPTDTTRHPLDQDYEALPLEDVKVTFLPLGFIPDLNKKSKYRNAFSVVYFSNSLVHHLTPEMNTVFADKCTVLVESALFMLELKKEQVSQFLEKVTAMGRSAGCKELEKCDAEQDGVIKMYFTR